MGAKTRNSMLMEARRRAEELAQERRRREDQLGELATEYFTEILTAEQLVEDAERAAAALIEEARQKASAGRLRGDDIILRMRATGEPRNGVAQLLGISASYVGTVEKAKKESATTAESEVGDEHPADGEH